MELVRAGFDLAGTDSTGSASAILKRLRDVHDRRNELQHERPDARAALVYEAATVLVAELPGFFRDYSAWMRALGFGEQRA